MTRRQVFVLLLYPLLSLAAAVFALARADTLQEATAAAYPAAIVLLLAPAALMLAYNRQVLPQLHRALAAYSVGDEPTVRGIVAALDRSRWRSLVTTNLRYIEALMAFRAGDLLAARRLLDQVLAAPASLLLRPAIFTLRASARSLRALVAALQGDDAQAEADATALDADRDGMADVPAMVALARAVVMLRAGQHERLQRHLDQHRSLLLGAPIGKARTLARALLRPWVMPGRDAYRSGAAEGELADDPATGWITRIAPSLAPLLARRPVEPSDAPAPRPAPRPAAAATAAATRVEVPPPGKTPVVAKRMVAVWAVIVLMFVAIWQFLGTGPAERSSVRRSPARRAVQHQESSPAPLWPLGLMVAILPVAMGYTMRRQRRWLQRTHQADRDLLTGNIAACQSFYRELLAQPNVASQAQAATKLAAVARRLDDPADVLRWTTFGETKIASLEPATRLFLEGPLLAEEASALAVLGRPREASAVVARLEKDVPDSMMVPAARFSVGLVNLVQGGDLVPARALVQQRPDSSLVQLEIDVLADLVLATGEAEPREPVRTLLREAASDTHLTAWLERAAPGLMSEARSLAQA